MTHLKEAKRDVEECFTEKNKDRSSLMERGLHSLLVLLDVADIMTTHCARSHVTNERKELILFRAKE